MLEILQSKWKEILNYIKQEYDISDVSFDTWLMPLKLYDVKDNTVIIMVEEKLLPFLFGDWGVPHNVLG